MRKTSPSERIQEVMAEQRLRQVDVIEKAEKLQEKTGIKLNKSSLSMYLNGKTRPDDDKLFLLSLIFDVSEAWLMGYDAPKERMSVKVSGNENVTTTGDNNTTTINIDKTRNTSRKMEKRQDIANKTALDDLEVQNKIFEMLSRQTEVLEQILEELRK